MNITPLALRVSCAVLLLALVSGCTHTMKVAVKPTTLPVSQKLPHRAALVLNQELADYKYEMKMMGDTWVYPFGPALQDYARDVATHCFENVQIVPSPEQASADLVLIPRALKTEQSMGVWAWDKINLTMSVEWVARDRASQNTVWLRTITGEASEAGGNAFTGPKHRRILIQKLFDDLSLKTHAAFQEAPELKRTTAQAAQPGE